MKRTNEKMIQYIFEMISISKSINQNFKKCIWFKLQLIRYIDYWPLKNRMRFSIYFNYHWNTKNVLQSFKLQFYFQNYCMMQFYLH